MAGRKVELIVEDSAGPARRRADQARGSSSSSDQVHVAGRRALRPRRLRAGAEDRRVPDPDALSRHRRRRPHPAQAARSGSCARAGRRASRRTRSASTSPRPSSYKQVATIGDRLRLRLGGRSAASSRRSRRAAARSSRSSGRRSAPPTSRRTSRRSGATPTRCFALLVGRARRCSSPSSTRRPGSRRKLPLIGGGTDLRRVRAAVAWATRPRRDHARCIYSAALDTPANQRFVEGLPGEVRQGPSYYSETMLHERPVDRRGRQGGRRRRRGPREAPGGARARSRSRTRRAGRSSSTPTATRSRTSTSARSSEKDGELQNTVIAHLSRPCRSSGSTSRRSSSSSRVYDRELPAIACKHSRLEPRRCRQRRRAASPLALHLRGRCLVEARTFGGLRAVRRRELSSRRCGRASAARSSAPTAPARPRCSASSAASSAASGGGDHALRPRRDAAAAPPARRARARAHLPDHQPLPAPHRARELPARRRRRCARPSSTCSGRSTRYPRSVARAPPCWSSVGPRAPAPTRPCGTSRTASSASSRSRWRWPARRALLLLDEPTAGLSPAESQLMTGAAQAPRSRHHAPDHRARHGRGVRARRPDHRAPLRPGRRRRPVARR